MKCPKCDYLGFDTGDRCRNCGYDFSLMEQPETPLSDLPLRDAQDTTGDFPLGSPGKSHPVSSPPALPLFGRGKAADDEPMIRLPAAPRPPLAVRRTPDAPRFRPVSRPPRRPDPEPVLQFAEEVDDVPPRSFAAGTTVMRQAPTESGPYIDDQGESSIGRRLLAAGIDLTILLAIDLAVVYFTLRMAALTMNDWRALPPIPLAAFLVLLKAAYFGAFTACGGQTIGKMAARIQVVGDDSSAVDPARAARRVLAGTLSILTLGLGFVPALFGPDRRALHDRLAGTRVIARPS